MKSVCLPVGSFILGIAALGWNPALSIAQDPPRVATEAITQINYRGWDGSLLMEAEDPGYRAVVVPAVGGRILGYGNYHHNILWQRSDNDGQTLQMTGRMKAGGYQCDIGPELRGLPPRPLLQVGQYRSEITGGLSVRLTSNPDPSVGLQLAKEITISPESGDLGITQIMRNISEAPTSYCHWDRTLVRGGGYAIIPLGSKSRYAKKWAIKEGKGSDATYNGADPKSDRVKIQGSYLVAHCSGPATKIGVDSEAGWIAYAWRHFLFVKYFPVYPDGNYSDGGNTVELYWNEEFGELEPLSPEVTLQPGDSYQFPELWKIIELRKEVKSHRDARRLVKEIPPSPFR